MRKLSMHDAFAFARLLEKTDAKSEISRINSLAEDLKKSESDDVVKDKIGIEVIYSIIFNCAKSGIEEEFYKIVSDVVETKSPKDIEFMSFEELYDLFKEIALRNNLLSFFKQAVKSLK